ncbi:oxidoreductase [Dickeya fangzhongdai]|uniref:FAD-dependent oxidoreductase n=1 Tax=Dickeya fangzhongdai TaxID=1778540 RepID=UPI00057362A6|nr:FAD-dependent oxidoreductase [Dickeya fangzhongdai]KHN52945.1 oxidoreductase [Dickeya fangzhongdai]
MSEEKFDAIVVGAGVAGSVAGYIMAKHGMNVLIIERGVTAGCKNMTGGRLYAHSLEKIMPDFSLSAPLERRVVREKISFLSDKDAVTLDFHHAGSDEPCKSSYTVLRSRFDPWLVAQAEGAGAIFIPGIRVDSLVKKGERVTGVKAGDDVLEADIVILAEGVNALLGRSVGMVAQPSPHHFALGVKEVIALPSSRIEDRFGVQGDEGAAWLFAGTPSQELMGGGFIYTNQDSLSLGVVLNLANIGNASRSVPQMLEDFKQHPAVSPLVQGGDSLEYSAHLIPEGGLSMVPQLSGDGVMIVGDAAGLCLNLGYTVRGMDLAIASAEAAALTAIEARKQKDFSNKALANYHFRLKQSFVLQDMHRYRNIPAMMNNPRLFKQYPQMVTDIMSDMFAIDGSPAKPLRAKVMQRVRQVGLMHLLKDTVEGGWSL